MDKKRMQICVFEDKDYTNLLPLVYTYPVYELRCGIDTLIDKIIRKYKTKKVDINLFCRNYLAEIVKEKYGLSVNKIINDNCLFINGKIILDKIIPVEGEEEICIKDKTVIYARLNKEKSMLVTPENILSGKIWEKLKLNTKLVDLKYPLTIIKYPWNCIHQNNQQITKDFIELTANIKNKIKGELYPGTYILNKSQVFIGKETIVKPGVVIDAEQGPVYIGENVSIQPNAVIEGPVFIGNRCIIRIGAKIFAGTSIGELSRVGGEVVESIIHSYSNKQHDGFLGHSYIGKWCNLGAGTNTSNLKNNYGNVKVYIEGKLIDTEHMFVGLIMADYSKCGIGTMFNTGTVVGVNANIFGSGLIPKFIPSFSWLDVAHNKINTYNLEKAITTAKVVMSRRKLAISKLEEKLIHKIFELTKNERNFK